MKKKFLLPIFVAIMCFLVFTKLMENPKQSVKKEESAPENTEKELLLLMIKILKFRDFIIHTDNKLKYLDEYEDLIDQKNVLSKNFSPETIKKITEQAQAQFANNNKHNAKPCTLF